MGETSNIVDEQPEHSGYSADLLVLGQYASDLEEIRKLVLFRIDQRKITLDTIDTLVERLSQIIDDLDRLRHNFDHLHTSLDEVQEHITLARESLFVASYVLEKRNKKASDIVLLHKRYAMFTKSLSNAIELLQF